MKHDQPQEEHLKYNISFASSSSPSRELILKKTSFMKPAIISWSQESLPQYREFKDCFIASVFHRFYWFHSLRVIQQRENSSKFSERLC
uniref:Ovule protein n=1 Tax=Steinernema glaseri TaxID=37863 RepID=A0A1I8A2A6_9BILA